jgi:hypothetical protein
VGDPVVGVSAEDLGELLRDLQTRLRQLDRVQRNRLLDLRDLEAEALVNRPPDALDLLAGGLLVLPSPSPVLAPTGGGVYQCTPRIR